jgi:hypothetical protein
LSPEDLEENRENNQLSIYGKGKVSAKVCANCIVEIKKSFPKLSAGWYDVLEKMLDEEKFTDQRLIDATKSLIRNCPYPEPSLSNIIGFDKSIKVYLWDDLLKITNEYSPESRKIYLNNYQAINFYGQQRYAKKEDVERYNLPTWKFEPKIKLAPAKEKEEITDQPDGEFTVSDLVRSFSIPKPRSKMKVLTKEEREKRQKQFQAILNEEKIEKINAINKQEQLRG